MSPLPDTSFLYALYRRQANSERAILHFRRLSEPLSVSGLLLLEFRQSVRFQEGLNRQDKTMGFPRNEGARMLADLRHDLEAGTLNQVSVEWIDVHLIAERLSQAHTPTGRHRLVDILHIATCLHLGAKEFLTFDENQKKLAKAEGLKVLL